MLKKGRVHLTFIFHNALNDNRNDFLVWIVLPLKYGVKV